MPNLDLAKTESGLKTVGALGFVLATISIGGGTYLTILFTYTPLNFEDRCGFGLRVGQIMLVSGVTWLLLWSYMYWQVKKLLRHLRASN